MINFDIALVLVGRIYKYLILYSGFHVTSLLDLHMHRTLNTWVRFLTHRVFAYHNYVYT